MKRTELLFSVILVPLDYCLLLLAAWLAYRLRFQASITELRPVLYDIPTYTYFRSAAMVALLWVPIFALYGLYNRRSTDSFWPEAGRVLLACTTGLVVIIIAVFFKREFFSSRFILLVGALLAVVLVIIGRMGVRILQHLLFRYGVGVHRVLVIGQNHMADEIVAEIRRRPELGYVVVAQLPAAAGTLTAMRQLGQGDKVDEIMFIEPEVEGAVRQQFYETCEECHLVFRYAPDLLRSPIGALAIEPDLGVPLIEVPETTIRGWNRVVKRTFDIISSSIAFLILWPLFIILIIAVRLDSFGPAIYHSTRIGRNKKFTLYKFRSMQLKYCIGSDYGGETADEYYRRLVATANVRRGPVPKIENDPRWTRLGRWLRRWSLDELPQLWNVWRGDMSLVGPRPHFPSEVAQYERHHHKVLAVKPGLSGLAQVSGRSDIDFDEEVRLDRYYIEHWTLLLDISILLRTVVAVFKPRRTL